MNKINTQTQISMIVEKIIRLLAILKSKDQQSRKHGTNPQFMQLKKLLIDLKSLNRGICEHEIDGICVLSDKECDVRIKALCEETQQNDDDKVEHFFDSLRNSFPKIKKYKKVVLK